MKRFFTVCFLISATSYVFAQAPQAKVTFEEYISKAAVPREVIAGFLRGPAWVQFDPEIGYTLRNSLVPWGMNRSVTIETTQPNGARTTPVYANRKARINTYGDSFTECAQVSDGETWQEYLAGHLGEPIRNFGVGGYGVYQAYRRMLREERTDHRAQYLILTICCDDPTRSLLRDRVLFLPWWDSQGGRMFHSVPWSNLEIDLKSGRFVEREQLLATPESLYQLTDSRWIASHFRDDLALQLSAYADGSVSDIDLKEVIQLARLLDFRFDRSLSVTEMSGKEKDDRQPMTPMQRQVGALLNRYGQRATIYILDKARDFADQNHAHLLVVLNFTTDFEKKVVRDDQEILDYLVKKKFDYVDINQAFRDEFQKAKTTMSFADYMKQYMVDGEGHLNPWGNHFVAYTLKDKVVSMLDPKPTPYQPQNAKTVNWDAYLRGGGYR